MPFFPPTFLIRVLTHDVCFELSVLTLCPQIKVFFFFFKLQIDIEIQLVTLFEVIGLTIVNYLLCVLRLGQQVNILSIM